MSKYETRVMHTGGGEASVDVYIGDSRDESGLGYPDDLILHLQGQDQNMWIVLSENDTFIEKLSKELERYKRLRKPSPSPSGDIHE